MCYGNREPLHLALRYHNDTLCDIHRNQVQQSGFSWLKDHVNRDFASYIWDHHYYETNNLLTQDEQLLIKTLLLEKWQQKSLRGCRSATPGAPL